MQARCFVPQLTRRAQTSNLLNVASPSLVQIRQFFDQAQKIKLLSKLANNQTQRSSHQKVATSRIRPLFSRKGTRPSFQISSYTQNSDYYKPNSKSLLVSRKSQDKLILSNPEQTDRNDQQRMYFKRFLMPHSERMTIQHPKMYLTISKMKINDFNNQSRTKIDKVIRPQSKNKRLFIFRNKQRKNRIDDFLKRCDSPWSSHRRSMTGDF